LIGQSFYKVFAKPTLKLDRFDPDVKPPIGVSHNPPLIARSDEVVKLEFDFVCRYINEIGSCCTPDATLFVSYGEGKDFSPITLTEEDQDSLRVLSANIPASNGDGQPLRYYLQVKDLKAGLDVRYPIEGTIDLFAASEFIPIDLPAEKQAKSGESVLSLPWGDGPEEAGTRKREGYPRREGPLAIDVAEDGRIALLDHVNGRVLLYDPTEKSFTSIPLPFPLHSQGDVQFDRNGQVAVFDPVGEPIDPSTARIPQLYRLLPDGRIDAVAPVFARIPAWLTKDLEVVDLDYSKIVEPYNPLGIVNSREAQRMKQPAELLAKYMTDSVHEVRFADTQKGIAFAVHSESPLGAITYFEKTPQGYVAVFEGIQIRMIWFGESGMVLKDVTLPRDDYSEINSLGRMAIDPHGTLYVLGSEEKGMVVHFVIAP